MRIAHLLIFSVISLCASAEASDVKFVATRISENCASILVSGEIRKGDTTALAALVAKNEIGCKGQDIEPVILFDSRGGDVQESLSMGRYIRSKKLATEVDRDAECLSACNLSFIGGISRHVNGYFGIHRPFAVELPADESDAQRFHYASVQRLKAYAIEMRVAPDLIERMMKISPRDIYFLSQQDMLSLGVTGNDPVWEDVFISREANVLGISREEFIHRQTKSKILCGKGLRPFPDPCYDVVMRTGRAPQ